MNVKQSSSTNKSVEFLKSQEMKESLSRNISTVEIAKREMAEFQEKVKNGEIKIENNNGLWCAVLDESKTVVKMGQYVSQTGPLIHFMKVVYANEDHKARVNEQSYHLNLSTNGMLKGYMRADMQEMTEYHPDGKIKSFSTKTSNSWHTAKWDNKNRLIGDVSQQQTTNQTAVVVPQIPGAGKTNDLGNAIKP